MGSIDYAAMFHEQARDIPANFANPIILPLYCKHPPVGHPPVGSIFRSNVSRTGKRYFGEFRKPEWFEYNTEETMAPGIIHRILNDKKQEIQERKKDFPLSGLQKRLERVLPAKKQQKTFEEALTQKKFSIIAEIKRKSPSQGKIRAELSVQDIAGIYQKNQYVSCISILTDHRYFGGTLEDLEKARKITNKPLLRKEFILDEYQLYEAVLYGADAVLLIATFLDADKLLYLVRVAKKLGIEVLVECHSAEDIKRIPFDIVSVIGINSRDLSGDLHTDLSVLEKILPQIPNGKTVIAESGIHTKEELKKVHDLGFQAALIGAGILTYSDISQGINQLCSLLPNP